MLDAKLPLIKKYAAIAALALVDCTVLSLSGSRRTYLSLIPALVIVAVFHLVRTARPPEKGRPGAEKRPGSGSGGRGGLFL